MALSIASRFATKYRVVCMLEKSCLQLSNRRIAPFVWSVRLKSKDAKPEQTGSGKAGTELDVARENPYAGLTMGQKVKEAGKDVSYLGISLAAIGMLGAMFYYIGRELFAGDSSTGVYSKAFKRCSNDSEVIVALGEPIKGYGEETRRGRRRHVSHVIFEQDGRQHMRMKFYIQGSDKKAEVNLEVVKDDSGKYTYRYLFVQIEQFPYRTIILEDNR
ncbi:mitochondrial import inner membrane translocase subunit Tim21-like [Mercenaria mercenaria]|uniref:mitochondrial import inner membrane translocase subunit Tim21-like n=1 Tax=Mercenaria mercenaria TaxID=6596 RepID=UPI00234E6C6F|nr:mitochondrial import inner membrane translocase subunit Tim21-like [Mercenaria mercenaria]